ncbi:MAG: deoxyribonuclease IV, partial [Deltaproteobacteria bacterium]
QKAVDAFIDEARRVEALGLSLFNFHPGSHLRQIDEQGCMALIAEGVKKAMTATQDVIFVLETTAGQGTNIGYTFEQLAFMLELIGNEKRTGVCLDTCHIFAAGYDLVNEYPKVMDRFKAIIGRNMLKAIHLNDCKSALGQKLDRHDSLGVGSLGWDVFRTIMQDPFFDDIPLILETIDDSLWAEEIKRLYSFCHNGAS